MAFSVFPDASHGPLRLGPGAISGPFDFAEMAGGTPRTMFLRIVKASAGCGPLGGKDPILRLQAGTGPPVDVQEHPDAVSIHDRPDGDSVPVATAKYFPKPMNVYLVQIVVHSSEASRWRIRIGNNDESERQFTWVVADNEPESAQPWLNVPQSVEFKAFVDETVTRAVEVANRGTGPLKLFPGGLASDSGFRLVLPLPGDILPTDCKDLVIEFKAPATSVSIKVPYVVKSNDSQAADSSDHNDHIILVANTTARPPRPDDTPVPKDPAFSGGRCRQCSCREFQPQPGAAGAHPVFGQVCSRAICGHDINEHHEPQ